MKSKNALKNSIKKQKPNLPRPPTPPFPDPGPAARTRWGILALVLLITAAAFFPVLGNGFVNWDDDEHLLANPDVQSPDKINLGAIFKGRVLKNYIPLTVLSFALEHKLFGFHPFIYHLNNLILHLVVVGLVYGFIVRLGFPLPTAGLAALLFAVHPMHVESVAWVSERKDLLYATFYLLSLRQYLNYLERRTMRSYFFTFAFGLLSVLAKPMAVSLPLVLCLLDWWKRRSISWSLLVDKIPFAAYVIPLIFWALFTTKDVMGVVSSPGQAVLILIWSFTFYFKKFLFPVILSPVYALPQPVNLGNPSYSGSLLACLLIAVFLWSFRRSRLVLFAFLYFVLSIFFLLHYNDLWHLSMVNDRFMYLPSLGFCLLLADLAVRGWEQISHRIGPVRGGYLGIVFLILAGLAGKTFVQSGIWRDGGTLWRHVLSIDPGNSRANSNLADHLLREDINTDEVLGLCQKAISLDPMFADARVNLGTLLGRRQDYDGAIEQFRKAVELDPGHAVAHANLGTAYTQKSELEQAAFHFEKACDLGFCPPPMQANLERIRRQLRTTDGKDQ